MSLSLALFMGYQEPVAFGLVSHTPLIMITQTIAGPANNMDKVHPNGEFSSSTSQILCYGVCVCVCVCQSIVAVCVCIICAASVTMYICKHCCKASSYMSRFNGQATGISLARLHYDNAEEKVSIH